MNPNAIIQFMKGDIQQKNCAEIMNELVNRVDSLDLTIMLLNFSPL